MSCSWSFTKYSEILRTVPNPSQHHQHPTLIALGEAIRHERSQQGISQEKLALMAEMIAAISDGWSEGITMWQCLRFLRLHGRWT